MTTRPFTLEQGDDNATRMRIQLRGEEVLNEPEVNRGTAFTLAERDALGLHGLLPSAVQTADEQEATLYEQFSSLSDDVKQWAYLTQLHDTNETMFYRLVGAHVEEMLPIVYTPTVGAAIERFSHLFRRPRGVFLNIDDVDGIDRALDATGLGPDDIDLVVASDGEAILGIGDWGVGGIDISIGKLAVYTVAAGIDPARVLAVGLDVGTNRESLLNDPRYLGVRRSRVRGEAYDTFIDAYVASASRHFPHAILHWEDFGAPQARGILARYGDTLCTFDDDIQGTASVGLACALAGVRVAGGKLTDQQIVVFGAGSAGVGIADLLASAMRQEGLPAADAAGHVWLLDRPGLLTSDMDGLQDFQVPYAKDPADVAAWRAPDGSLGLAEVVAGLHPTMLVGTSGVTGAFTEAVVRSMRATCERPIILPMSNPTSLAEQTPANLLEWTDGAALVATGSPFGPVERDGVTYRIGQANNALMFPGLGLGVIVCRAATMPESLFLAAARALAALADPADPADGLLPDIGRLREVSATVAVDVVKVAMAEGIARVQVADPIEAVHEAMWQPEYLPIVTDVEREGGPGHGCPHRRRSPRRPDGRGGNHHRLRDRRRLGEPDRRRHPPPRGEAVVHPRPQRRGGRVRRRRRRPGLGATGRGPGLIGPWEPAPTEWPVRLQAQRRFGVRDRDPHPEHRDRHEVLPGDRPRGDLRRCCVYVGTISSPGQMPSYSELALQAAILERGVGMVILPGDVGAATIEHPMVPHPIVTERPRLRPSDEMLDRAAALIADAGKIAIFGGEGTRDARDEVLELSRVLRAPVAYAYRGKDVLEHDNPAAVGMTGLLGWGGAHHAVGQCDLLLMLGTDFPYTAFLPADATIIQVDDRAGHLGRRAKIDLGLVGDTGETLRALLPRLTERTDEGFLDACLKRHRKAVEHLQTYVHHEGSGHGLRPEMVATALSDLAADDAVFTVDTGMCNVWGARYLHMKSGRRILASFGHGSMANAMPQAIGAKVGSPDRQVIALCGDGGFSMLMGELLTVAGLDIPVKLMIFNNSTLGMVRAEMMVVGYEPWGTDVTNPDFGALATAAGIHGERVEHADDVRPAIQRALDHPGPALIDFVTDPRALSMPPQTTFTQAKGFALTTSKLVFGGDVAEVWEQARSNIRDVGQVF